MTDYISSNDLVKTIRESGKAPDLATAHAYAFGMAWAFLTEEQKAACIRAVNA